VQNQANTNNRLMEATQRAAGFTKSSVSENVIYGIVNKVAQA